MTISNDSIPMKHVRAGRVGVALLLAISSVWTLHRESECFPTLQSDTPTAPSLHIAPVGSKGRRLDDQAKAEMENSTMLQTKPYVTSANETLVMVPALRDTPVVYLITPTYSRARRTSSRNV